VAAEGVYRFLQSMHIGAQKATRVLMQRGGTTIVGPPHFDEKVAAEGVYRFLQSMHIGAQKATRVLLAHGLHGLDRVW
jgi:hypothetical protein